MPSKTETEGSSGYRSVVEMCIRCDHLPWYCEECQTITITLGSQTNTVTLGSMLEQYSLPFSGIQAPLCLTEQEVEAGKTRKGGYSRKQLRAWGVPWPPVKGWKRALLNGTPIPQTLPTA